MYVMGGDGPSATLNDIWRSKDGALWDVVTVEVGETPDCYQTRVSLQIPRFSGEFLIHTAPIRLHGAHDSSMPLWSKEISSTL